MRRILYGYNDCTIPAIGIEPFRLMLSGLAGRPRLLVNLKHVEFLRSAGYTWEEVLQSMHVSRTTLWRRLGEMNVPLTAYTDINLDELVSAVSD